MEQIQAYIDHIITIVAGFFSAETNSIIAGIVAAIILLLLKQSYCQKWCFDS